MSDPTATAPPTSQSPTPAQSPNFKRLARLAAGGPGVQSVVLRGRGLVIELRVLAPDLFRLRAAPGALPETPSWAVVKTDWTPTMGQVRLTRAGAVVRTEAGELAVEPRRGAWRLTGTRGRPVFATGPEGFGFAEGQPRIELELAERERLFGLGTGTGPLDRRGRRQVFWNVDVLGHTGCIHPGVRNLYVSIPFALSSRDGRVAGLFWDNPARQEWDMGQSVTDRWRLTASSGPIDLYLFLGPTGADVLARYTELTGRMPLPPRWALGYHQSRHGYGSRRELESIARSLRRRRLPCDALHLDIPHLRGYRVFTFSARFSRPREMLARLRRRGFHAVAIVDPGVKVDPRFGVFRRGAAGCHFVRMPDGCAAAAGRVWPGLCHFPDFTAGAVRKWWGREQARLLGLGVAGIWNDMNEPATFDGPGRTLPGECVHGSDHGPRRHHEVHNVYGMQMARASREGALASQPDVRPFVLTRAGYAGVQRYACVWTGDTHSCWEHLAESIPMMLNLGLSGVAFCGADVGGFLDHATGELLARWTQAAALTPFLRNHADIRSRAQEPWAFGVRIEAIVRRCLELRSHLAPYLYGLFVEAHRRGTPVMRPLLWHHADDPVAVAIGDQFLLGASLLVAPVLTPGACARSVYLPAGNWYDFWTGAIHRGRQHVVACAELERLPLFVRAGSILPMVPVHAHAGQLRLETVSVHVWPGRSGQLHWYEDDGRSLGYARGERSERQVHLEPTRRGYELVWQAPEMNWPSSVRRWRVIVHAVPRRMRVAVGGRRVRSRYDPELALQGFEVDNEPRVLRATLGD